MSHNIGIDHRFEGHKQSAGKTQLIHGVLMHGVKDNVDDRQSLRVYLKASDECFKGFAQSYVAISAKGIVKAWHYHKLQTDIWFCPWGKIKVGLFDARSDSPTKGTANSLILGGGNNVTLAIPPGVYHGYVALSDEAMLINTTNKPYNPDDEFRAPWNDPRFGFDWAVENR